MEILEVVKPISVYRALLKGTAKLTVIILTIISISLSIGLIYNYFDFYPAFLSYFDMESISKASWGGVFLMGFASLPFITVLLILSAVLIAILIFGVLYMGGYYE